MAQMKWLKVGAAAVLSVGMLAACGDGNDDDIEFEAPNLDTDTDPEDSDAPVVDGEEGEIDTDPDDEVDTGEDLEDEMGGSGQD